MSNSEPKIEEIILRRKSWTTADGAYFFEDRFEFEGFFTAEVVTTSAWLLEFYQLNEGEIYFTYAEKKISPESKNFAILYTPFSITRPAINNIKALLTGIASENFLPEKFRLKPLIFEFDLLEIPKDLTSAFKVLDSSRNIHEIIDNKRTSLLALKAKKLIDENYRIFPSIGRIAKKLDVSHEHLTRQFKQDFGLTPSSYLHKLRSSDASFRLRRGEKIINVSMDVGYNDLSRFYKQFRKNTHASPGFCKAK